MLGLIVPLIFALVLGCSAPPSAIPDPSTVRNGPVTGPAGMEGGGALPGSTQAGNPPALDLEPQNPSAKLKVVSSKDPAIPTGQLYYDWRVRWEPPPAPVTSYEVERKIGQQGTWERIGTTTPDVLTINEQAAYAAAHIYRIKASDAEGRFAYSKEVTDRTPAACEFEDGWAMVSYSHGCFQWRAVWVLDPQNAYFVGDHKDGRGVLLHRRVGPDGKPSFQHIFLSIHPTSVWAADPASVFIAGSSSGKGALVVYDGSEAKDMDVVGGIRAPLHSIYGLSRNQIFAVGDVAIALQFNGLVWEAISGLDRPNLDVTYRRVWGLSPKDAYILGDKGVLLRFDGFRWNQIPLSSSSDFFDILGTDPGDLYLSSDKGIYRFDGRTASLLIKGTQPQALWGPDDSHFYGAADDIVDYKRNFPGLTPNPEIDMSEAIFTDIHGLGDQVFVTSTEGIILEKTSDGYWQDTWTESPFFTLSTAKAQDVMEVYKYNVFSRPKSERAEKFRPSLAANYTHLLAVSEKDLYLIEEVLGQWRLFHMNGITGAIRLLTPFLLEGTPQRLWGDSTAIFVATSQAVYRYTPTSFKRMKAEETPLPPDEVEFKSQKISGTDLEITALARINETNQWAIANNRYLLRYCH